EISTTKKVSERNQSADKSESVTAPVNKTITNSNNQKNVKIPEKKQSSRSFLTNSEKKKSESGSSFDFKETRKNPEKKNAASASDQNETYNIFLPPAKTEPQSSQINSYDSARSKKEVAVVEKKDTPKDSLLISKKAPPEKHKTSLWKIEITGGIGFSDIHQSLFKQSNNTGIYAFAPANGSISAAPAPLPSEVTTGFSFIAGLAVNRALSRRISLSAGLNYRYFSTRIHTGNAVDSSISVYNYAAYSPSPLSYSVNRFYQNGSALSYTNQYHFLELPVTVKFQLNKNEKLPVYWEAGLSLSYLISTNALFFDPNENVYYQNKELFNKTQLSWVTSILIGIPLGKNQLQLGPQLQYGFTDLIKSGTGSSEHLFYGGFKISYVLPWK
ncbi:MAG TPA: outer membrane beta-barrel protein, partial [Puia sp.]|nr:outer membrane beta-barrel protein [Puia sp.]